MDNLLCDMLPATEPVAADPGYPIHGGRAGANLMLENILRTLQENEINWTKEVWVG